MKKVTKLLERLSGLKSSIARYPLTAVFLLVIAFFVAESINTEKNNTKIILALVVGAMMCAVLQVAQERFFSKPAIRIILMGMGSILTFGYYMILRAAPRLSLEIGIRTAVVLLALFFAFIWVPVIRSKVTFNESFIVVFKSFFHSTLYAAVIMGGCSLIIMAVDTLIMNVSDKAYSHTSNIVFVLFAPLFFLSLIPVYPGKKNEEMEADKIALQEEKVNKASFCPKFLEVLISYIIIPLTAVFTIILILYIIRNIRGEFWTNNLLEPLLVSYAIIIIIVYILASRLENKFAGYFRKIFPKVLVPIVLFQIASSILSLGDTGITHTRYFVIIFGVFAACAGIAMSVLPVNKNGILAAMLIGFSLVSIIPPLDAFTISRTNQTDLLKTTLTKNEMFKDSKIFPNSNISDADKKVIVSTVQYLEMMEYTDRIAWLPEDFTVYEDFYNTFGFNEYEAVKDTNKNIYVSLNIKKPITITGYDFMIRTYVNSDENIDPLICNLNNGNDRYRLEKELLGDQQNLVMTDSNNQEVMRFNMNDVFGKYQSYAANKTELTQAEATSTKENDQIIMTVLVQELNINVSFSENYNYVDFYVFIQFK